MSDCKGQTGTNGCPKGCRSGAHNAQEQKQGRYLKCVDLQSCLLATSALHLNAAPSILEWEATQNCSRTRQHALLQSWCATFRLTGMSSWSGWTMTRAACQKGNCWTDLCTGSSREGGSACGEAASIDKVAFPPPNFLQDDDSSGSSTATSPIATAIQWQTVPALLAHLTLTGPPPKASCLPNPWCLINGYFSCTITSLG